MGALITLEATGQLLDGTPFRAANCIRLVPPGAGGATLDIESTVQGIWVDVSPPDMTLNGGGFASFTRNYFEGTVVTLSVARRIEGRPFTGWAIGNTRYPDPTLVITLTDNTTVTATLGRKPRRR